MDSEMIMFFIIVRVFLCLGDVLMMLLYVTELDGHLYCTINDWFVNDRLDTGLEIAGTGRDDGLPCCE